MGTLFDQSVRDYNHVKEINIDSIAEQIEYLVINHGYTIEQSINILKVLEYRRRTSIMVDDFDRKDEQLGGFGDLITEFIRNHD